jgi:hypothetical protein
MASGVLTPLSDKIAWSTSAPVLLEKLRLNWQIARNEGSIPFTRSIDNQWFSLLCVKMQ